MRRAIAFASSLGMSSFFAFVAADNVGVDRPIAATVCAIASAIWLLNSWFAIRSIVAEWRDRFAMHMRWRRTRRNGRRGRGWGETPIHVNCRCTLAEHRRGEQ